MRGRRIGFLLALVTCIALPGVGETVRGADKMVCALQTVTGCEVDFGCEIGEPEDWNMPTFLVVDVAAKTLSTTAANERPRKSPIQSLLRQDEEIYLHGLEEGRPFAIVIDEETGLLSGSVVSSGFSVSAFGTCTPLPMHLAGEAK